MLAVYYCRELSEEEVLIDYLFEEYRPTARPVLRSEDTVLVNLQFSLMHIKELVSAPASQLMHIKELVSVPTSQFMYIKELVSVPTSQLMYTKELVSVPPRSSCTSRNW